MMTLTGKFAYSEHMIRAARRHDDETTKRQYAGF